MVSVAYASALELKHAIAKKRVSPVELVQAALDHQAKVEPKINAFVTVTAEMALEAAKAAEIKIMKNEKLGALEGLPISVKDVIPVKGVRLTSGSRAMADTVAAIDAPVVERLKAAGACIVGKTTASEFGCKAVGDSPLTGVTRNPWNLRKTSGGSSAGAAASVAAGVTPFAVATDGGGSIRIPCALTGLFGIKAQFARVPMYPVSAAPTLAHVGALGRTVRDAAMLLSVEAGPDLRDPFSVAEKTPDFLKACDTPVTGMRVAWSPTLGYAKADPEVIAIAEKAAKTFSGLGCIVEQVDNVFDQDPVDLFTSEFYAGIGTRLRPILEKSTNLLDPAVAQILRGALEQSVEDYYTNVFRRYELRETIRQFFEKYDLLLSPTLPVVAFDVNKDLPPMLEGSDRNVVSWVYYTYPFNLTGQPAASVPGGYSKEKLPVGLQIVARTNKEVDIFRAAAAFEEAAPWAGRQPPLS